MRGVCVMRGECVPGLVRVLRCLILPRGVRAAEVGAVHTALCFSRVHCRQQRPSHLPQPRAFFQHVSQQQQSLMHMLHQLDPGDAAMHY